MAVLPLNMPMWTRSIIMHVILIHRNFLKHSLTLPNQRKNFPPFQDIHPAWMHCHQAVALRRVVQRSLHAATSNNLLYMNYTMETRYTLPAVTWLMRHPNEPTDHS